MEGIIIENIKGRFINYLKLIAKDGFCFYDKDDEQRYYLTSITTPITDTQELKRKYIVVQGNAEILNKELEEKRVREMKVDGEV